MPRKSPGTGQWGSGGGTVPSPREELAARYREIDGLMAGSRQTSEFRHWQAITAELMRKTLGFHPAVVEFQGLRFRAGPVHLVTADEIAGIPQVQHDARMRQDLAEAKRLLRRALAELKIDVDAPLEQLVDPLLTAVETLAGAERERARQAAARLQDALRSAAPSWEAVGPELTVLLGLGLAVARCALAAVAARLSGLR